MHLTNVTLEMSLKPFRQRDEAFVRSVCREVFVQWHALLRHYLVAYYYNLLPTGLAGDVVRGYRVRTALPSAGDSYTVILVERVAGLGGLLGVAALAMLLGPRLPESFVRRALD
ncbi:MAG: hypothetical protein AAB654_05055, partial [Acidobacteriota bacterium]